SRISLLINNKYKKLKKVADKDYTVVLKAYLPPLPDNKILCITCSGKKLKNWEIDAPLFLYQKDDFYSIKLNLSKENTVTYKLAIFDSKLKTITDYEDGENRIFYNSGKKVQSVIHLYPKFNADTWKGAGLCVPVSSLRSVNDWGIGSFSDLKILTDWCVETGFKMIQLLPVNDTTATHTLKDSYPYSCISAFALHPIYLDVNKLAESADFKFDNAFLNEIEINNKSSVVDFPKVYSLKIKVLREIFNSSGLSFKDDFAWFDFFDLNREWLTPYAVFCFLRDKYGSSDFSSWPEHHNYIEDNILALADPSNEFYNEIAFYYFIQFHLHLQFKDVVDYAHKNNVILKGDLPIGVGRNSVETWMFPQLFNPALSAGAPPDMFSKVGQNWGFPTYNWEEMKKNDYSWWRKRMESLAVYFDAVRIDHVIGFLRIWSIPLNAVNGQLGYFDPAKGLSKNDFEFAGINFDEQRFCEPFYSNSIEDKDNTPLTNVLLLRHNNLYHFRIDMQQTSSYKQLSDDVKYKLDKLYQFYFYEKQNDLWKEGGMEKLTMIRESTDMLVCAENLGMVPEIMSEILQKLSILSLIVQRMPLLQSERFSSLINADYLSVVTPSTHDMTTIREWWENDRESVQYYFNNVLGKHGLAPFYCEPEIARAIINMHLNSPAMWSIFLLQDVLATHEGLRRADAKEERINDPADDNHNWNYRLHIPLEKLVEQNQFNEHLAVLLEESGR
ncbi:MAG: 4-alpha-glucanotransferase, partial [Ferruginibacter sp.]